MQAFFAFLPPVFDRRRLTIHSQQVACPKRFSTLRLMHRRSNFDPFLELGSVINRSVPTTEHAPPPFRQVKSGPAVGCNRWPASKSAPSDKVVLIIITVNLSL